MTQFVPEMHEVMPVFKIKDRWSAHTHFAGFILSIIGMPVLLTKAARFGATTGDLVSYSIFMLSMILLYGASTAYHSFRISDRVDMVLKKFDHLSIFILIAGSYTPVCTIVLKGTVGVILLRVVWGIAIAGMIFKLFWVTCPRWVSSVLYLAMGWACAAVLPIIYSIMPAGCFALLTAGGIFYSIGAVIYAIKKPLLRNPEFGNHELFHCFVLAGSLCHYLMALLYFVHM